MRELLAGYSIKLSYDEWNTWYSWYRPENAYDGIFTAALLNMVISKAEKLGISLCCHFEAVNEGAIIVNPDGTSRLSSMGKVMSVMKNHSEGKLLFADYESVITEKVGTVTVTIINRSFDKKRKYILPAIGEVILSKLYFSEELIPHTVLTESDFSYNKKENGIELTLPPHSFLHMEIKL